MTIDASGLSGAVREALNEYGQEVREITRDTVRSVARTCRKEIQADSPRKSKKYAKGWRIEETVGRLGDVTETVYNAEKPGLIHLLEHGHAKVDGGRVEGKPHVGPAEERARESLVRGLERKLSR